MMDIGYYFGKELNESNDNLWFMLLFKRLNIFELSEEELIKTLNILITALSKKGMLSEEQKSTVNEISKIERNFYNKKGFIKLAGSLTQNCNKHDVQKWGWKEPNSHVVIEQIRKSIPEMKYIHVIRNGLDMAFSENQNQLRLWGSLFLDDSEINPKNSLKFWCLVHKKLLDYSQSMGENFLLLNFDDFCGNPIQGLQKLENFINIKFKPKQKQHILGLIKPLKSVDRYKDYDLSVFDAEDLDYVKELGFGTSQI